jgi:hypothetical protein
VANSKFFHHFRGKNEQEKSAPGHEKEREEELENATFGHVRVLIPTSYNYFTLTTNVRQTNI